MWSFELVFTDVCHSLKAQTRLRLSLPLIALPISQGHTEGRVVSPIMGCEFDAILICHHLHYCCIISFNSSLGDTLVQFMKWWCLQLVSLCSMQLSLRILRCSNKKTQRGLLCYVTGCACEGSGSVRTKIANRRDEFADLLTSLCVSTRQQGKGRKIKNK